MVEALLSASSITSSMSFPKSQNNPLSGPTMKYPVEVFSATAFLAVPTPGSTTQRKTVPSGKL